MRCVRRGACLNSSAVPATLFEVEMKGAAGPSPGMRFGNILLPRPGDAPNALKPEPSEVLEKQYFATRDGGE